MRVMEDYDCVDPTFPCRICGAKSTGLHYGVTSCEGCKVFYKRYIGKHQQYKCYFGGSCVIDLRTRSRCKACRFKKCLEEGMSVGAIRLGRTPKLFKAFGSDMRTLGGSFGDVKKSESKAIQTSGFSEKFNKTLEPSLERNLILRTGKDRCLSMSVSPMSQVSSESSIDPPGCSGGSDNGIALLTPTRPQRTRSSLSSNLQFLLTDFMPDLVKMPLRPCHFPDIQMPGLSKLQPSIIQKYWGVMKARNNVLEDSIRAVTEAADAVFSRQISLNEEYTDKLWRHGLIPYQPETTLEQMLMFVQGSVAEFAERVFNFSMLLPGFTYLEQQDRTSLVRDRWYLAWLITHARCYRDGECYHPIGPYHLHYCRYWMRQMLDTNFVRFIFSITAQINELNLTLTESFLLLAVALFKTDSQDSVVDGPYIDLLCSHYLDALIHLIGPGRGNVLMKLRSVISRFSVVNEVHRRFILVADLTQTPLGGTWQSDEMALLMAA